VTRVLSVSALPGPDAGETDCQAISSPARIQATLRITCFSFLTSYIDYQFSNMMELIWYFRRNKDFSPEVHGIAGKIQYVV
jgi:hypothetical protein